MVTLYELYSNPSLFITLVVIIAIWEIIWKGCALWKAARKSQKGWFIILLIVNSLGILSMIYLLFFSKEKKNQVAEFPTIKEDEEEES